MSKGSNRVQQIAALDKWATLWGKNFYHVSRQFQGNDDIIMQGPPFFQGHQESLILSNTVYHYHQEKQVHFLSFYMQGQITHFLLASWWSLHMRTKSRLRSVSARLVRARISSSQWTSNIPSLRTWTNIHQWLPYSYHKELHNTDINVCVQSLRSKSTSPKSDLWAKQNSESPNFNIELQ